jgi:phosphoglycolate phosphatase-like HAD superfamily hydrolase
MTHKPKNIELYIFDWSGVISDDRKPVYQTNMSILRDYGKPFLSFDEFFASSVRMTFLEVCRLHNITEDAAILTKLFKERFEKECKLGNKPTHYKNASAVLKSLKNNGKIIAILSSHPEKFVRGEAEQYGIAKYISHIKGGSDDKGADLKYIYKKFNYAPKTVLYIGDTIYDIRAAKTAGISSAGITGGYHAKEQLMQENPGFLFNSLMELANL